MITIVLISGLVCQASSGFPRLDTGDWESSIAVDGRRRWRRQAAHKPITRGVVAGMRVVGSGMEPVEIAPFTTVKGIDVRSVSVASRPAPCPRW